MTPGGESLQRPGAMVARVILAVFMGVAGVGHFRSTDAFLAQVPPFLPQRELIVYVSGVIELGFAAALLFTRGLWRARTGWLLAAFYVVIFPGNISQFVTQTPAFGLDSDVARAVRLCFQPLLVVWALWCTGARADWRRSRRR